MKKRVYRINGDDVRLILSPGCTLLDDLRWLRFVISTPPTPFKPVGKVASERGIEGIVGRAGG